MAQTDRQADIKATHWNSAIYDLSGQWEAMRVLPEFVKEVHTQQETCPTTGRVHYQTHVVCNRQVRLRAMCDWIKRTKWQALIGKEHINNSLNYCRKKETAVEGTFEVIKGEPYLRIHELLLEIAKTLIPTLTPYPQRRQTDLTNPTGWLNRIEAWEKQFLFKNAARKIVAKDLTWINKISNPVVEKMWNYFHIEVIEQVRVRELGLGEAQPEGSYIIETPREVEDRT